MLPPFCRTHEDHDDKSGGLKIVGGKSTDFSFATAIPNHSRPARRLVLAAAYGGRFELWGARIVRCSWSQPGGYPQSYSPDQGPHTKAICDELVAFNGRRGSLHLDGRGIASWPFFSGKTLLKVSEGRSLLSPVRSDSKTRYRSSWTKGFPHSSLFMTFRLNRFWMSSAAWESC